MTLVAAFTFPWDVIGDPRAAGRHHPGLASDQDLRVAAAAVDRFLAARTG